MLRKGGQRGVFCSRIQVLIFLVFFSFEFTTYMGRISFLVKMPQCLLSTMIPPVFMTIVTGMIVLQVVAAEMVTIRLAPDATVFNMSYYSMQSGLVTYSQEQLGIPISYDFPVSPYSAAYVTITFWIFVGDEPCTSGFCGILYRIGADFETPAVMITPERHLFIQNKILGNAKDTRVEGKLSKQPLEKNCWSWVSVSLGEKLATIAIVSQPTLKSKTSLEVLRGITIGRFSSNFLWPKKSSWFVGGSMFYHSFAGALLNVRVYLSERQTSIKTMYDHDLMTAVKYDLINLLTGADEGEFKELSEIRAKSLVPWVPDSTATDDEVYETALQRLEKSKFEAEEVKNVEMVLKSIGFKTVDKHFRSNTLYALLLLRGLAKPEKDNRAHLTSRLLLSSMNGEKLASFVLGYMSFYGSQILPRCCECAYKFLAPLASLGSGFGVRELDSFVSPFTRLEKERLHSEQNEMMDVVEFTRVQADMGAADAQYNMGVYYMAGRHGMEVDVPEAARLFRQAGLQGQPDALFNLGVMHLTGEGVEKNKDRALFLLRKAAEKDHGHAVYALGAHYIESGDIEKGMEYIFKARNLGCPLAFLQLGKFYKMGIITEKSIEKAFENFKEAFKLDNEEAAVELADMFMTGKVKESSCSNAVKYLLPAASRIEPIAVLLNQALSLYLKSSQEDSLTLYTLLSEAGVEIAQYNSAVLYLELYGRSNETLAVEGAVKHFNRSAIQNHHESLVRMGDYHYYGTPQRIEQNKSVAASLYRQAVDSGSIEGAYNLGYMRENMEEPFSDESAEENMEKALELYSQCCELSMLLSNTSFSYLPHETPVQFLSIVSSRNVFAEASCIPCAVKYGMLKAKGSLRKFLYSELQLNLLNGSWLALWVGSFNNKFSDYYHFDYYDVVTVVLLALLVFKIVLGRIGL